MSVCAHLYRTEGLCRVSIFVRFISGPIKAVRFYLPHVRPLDSNSTPAEKLCWAQLQLIMMLIHMARDYTHKIQRIVVVARYYYQSLFFPLKKHFSEIEMVCRKGNLDERQQLWVETLFSLTVFFVRTRKNHVHYTENKNNKSFRWFWKEPGFGFCCVKTFTQRKWNWDKSIRDSCSFYFVCCWLRIVSLTWLPFLCS